MKLVRLLWPVVVIAAGVLSSGCGSSKCGPANCATGCCDAKSGLCVLGNTNDSCGTSGSACAVCTAATTCQAGICNTTSGGCNANNCATGCCVQNSCVSFGQQTATQCGTGGAACTSCGAGTCNTTNGTCSGAGACNAANCTGCCEGSTCVVTANETTALCGVTAQAGAACIPCGNGQTCTGGTCTGGSCTAANCTGCCVGNNCVPTANESRGQCGTNAAACAACSGTQSCIQGSCQTCTGCVDGNGACQTSETTAACGIGGVTCVPCGTGQTCNANTGQCTGTTGCNAGNCTGCCGTTGCVTPGTSNAACGLGGAACAVCTTNQCISGLCGGPVAHVGDPCAQASDCASLGTSSTCRLKTSTNVPYTNGFCTVDCTSAACPTGSNCVTTGGAFGETTNLCWPLCTAGTNACREPGYACYTVGSGPSTNNCWIDPAEPAGLVGTACTMDATCQTATGPGNGGCLTAALADGGPSGFLNGYCTAQCNNWDSVGQTFGNQYCAGGACLPLPSGVALCFESCTTPGSTTGCSTGYVCNMAATASLVTGVCLPNCNNPGAGCATGTTCAASGICQ